MAVITLLLRYNSHTPISGTVEITPALRGTWSPVSSSVTFTASTKTSRGGAGHLNDLFFRKAIGGFGQIGHLYQQNGNLSTDNLALISLLKQFATRNPIADSVEITPALRGTWSPVSSSVTFTASTKTSRGGAGHLNDLFFRKAIGGFGEIAYFNHWNTTLVVSALVNVTQARSQTGISRLSIITSEDQLGVAAIRNTTTQNQTGVSKITDTVQQDQLGVANIYATVLRTQAGVSRIRQQFVQDQTGVSLITVRVQQNQSGVANIYATTTRTQTGRSSIRNTTTQNQTGVTKITNLSTQTQTGVSRIQVTVAVTESGISRIQVTVLQTQSGVSRIQLRSEPNQFGISRIQTTVPQDQLGVSNIYATTNRDQLGVAAIQNQTDRLQTGVSRVQTTVVWDQTGVSRVLHQRTQDQTGVSRLFNQFRKDQFGKARIADPQYLFASLFDRRFIEDPADSYPGTVTFLSGDAQFQDWIVGYRYHQFAYGPPLTERYPAPHKKQSQVSFDFQEINLFVEATMEEDVTPEAVTINTTEAHTSDWISGVIQIQTATISNKTTALVTQDAGEVLRDGQDPPAHTTQIAGEVLMQPASNVRFTQDAVEVLHQINVGWMQQEATEALANQIGSLRYAVVQQCVVEALQSIKARVRETQLALEALKGENDDPPVNQTQVAAEVLRQQVELDVTPSFVHQVAIEAMKNSNVIPANFNHVSLEMIFTVTPAARINHMAQEICRNATLIPAWINHQSLELIRNAAVTPARINHMAIEILVRPEYDPTVSSLVNNPKTFY